LFLQSFCSNNETSLKKTFKNLTNPKLLNNIINRTLKLAVNACLKDRIDPRCVY